MSKSSVTTAAEQRNPDVDAKHAHLGKEAPLLNTDLHLRIMAEGTAKPSTYESAIAALKKLRAQRSHLQPPAV
jgi:predicted house-cleaning NTP pyrophosphatase (Maf/HAM1 superfamily)